MHGTKRYQAAWLTLVLTVVLVAGCAGIRTRPAPEPDDAQLGRLSSEIADCHQVLYGVIGKIKLKSDSLAGLPAVRGWCAVRFPDSIRLEIQDPLGRPAFFVVIAGGQLKVLDAASATYYEGPARPETIARFLGVGLDAEWAARVMTGAMLHGLNSERAFKIERGHLLAESPDGVDRWLMTVDSASGQIDQVRRQSNRQTNLLVGFTEYQPDGSCPMPREISVRSIITGAELELRYLSADWSPQMDENLFILPVPEGARVVELE